MDVKRSPLQQIMFASLDTKISLKEPIEPQSESIDDLDVDLSILNNNENDHLIRVMYHIRACRGFNDRYGLDIDVQTVCDFAIDADLDVTSEVFHNLINYSATAIAYNNARVYIQNISAYYPVDTYILPTIDLNDLCAKYYSQNPGSE